MQQKLSLQLVTLLAGVSGPARRQALKNVGFLYAIQNGAKVIAEAELSAIAMVSSIPVLREFHTMAGEEVRMSFHANVRSSAFFLEGYHLGH